MNRYRLLFASFSILALFNCGMAQAGSHHHGVNVNTGDESTITNCNQLHVDFDGGSLARSEQDFTLHRGEISRLSLRPGQNGGIIVHSWDRDDYQIKACKAAGGRSDSGAQDTLGRISVSTNGGDVAASGPRDGDDWVVFFLVDAPHQAVLNMQTVNGPMSMNDVSGAADLVAVNGPISLRDCSGQVRAHAENGPIDFSGKSGDFHLDAINGPITVHLTGTQWAGAGLDARTKNGPLDLKIPDGYASGVSVQTSGNSPFSCHVSACHDVHGDWTNGARDIRLGSGNTVVRLHTENGPVSIASSNWSKNANHSDKDRDDQDDDDQDSD
jgi:DUF4097 and DUF4098 domain-containing protein YvlB